MGHSGLDLLKLSFSHFDPNRTLATIKYFVRAAPRRVVQSSEENYTAASWLPGSERNAVNFIGLVGGVAAWPPLARAQRAEKVVGFLRY